jgi:REP element-mobilizing transposase RayT
MTIRLQYQIAIMNIKYPESWPEFYTATITDWKPLLQQNNHKDIIIESLQFLVNDKRIILFAFVVMTTHIHLIWQACHGHTLKNVKLSFLKFTAQKIKFDLLKNDPAQLQAYKVNAADREYRFWKRRSLGIELFSPPVFQQKLDYIHYNPVKAKLCSYPEEYRYSSAKFYQTQADDFNMLCKL